MFKAIGKEVRVVTDCLTVNEAARLADRTVDQVRYLIRKKELPGVTLFGRTWVLPKSAIEVIRDKTRAI
jgi:excisionase family DNA binding protein